jgi:hypothetical protein
MESKRDERVYREAILEDLRSEYPAVTLVE